MVRGARGAGRGQDRQQGLASPAAACGHCERVSGEYVNVCVTTFTDRLCSTMKSQTFTILYKNNLCYFLNLVRYLTNAILYLLL